MDLKLIPKWRVISHPHIKLTANRMCYNSLTNRKKKITTNGGSIGIWLDNKNFLVKSKLDSSIELDKKEVEYCPFSNGTIKI